MPHHLPYVLITIKRRIKWFGCWTSFLGTCTVWILVEEYVFLWINSCTKVLPKKKCTVHCMYTFMGHNAQCPNSREVCSWYRKFLGLILPFPFFISSHLDQNELLHPKLLICMPNQLILPTHQESCATWRLVWKMVQTKEKVSMFVGIKRSSVILFRRQSEYFSTIDLKKIIVLSLYFAGCNYLHQHVSIVKLLSCVYCGHLIRYFYFSLFSEIFQWDSVLYTKKQMLNCSSGVTPEKLMRKGMNHEYSFV